MAYYKVKLEFIDSGTIAVWESDYEVELYEWIGLKIFMLPMEQFKVIIYALDFESGKYAIMREFDIIKKEKKQ